MKVGDPVRLTSAFQPRLNNPQFYRLGIIAGLVQEEISPDETRLVEVLVYLYDPDRLTIYTDEFGVQVIYSFYPEEVEPL